MSDPEIERALISVSDKEGIIEIARILQDRKIEILSTGGTQNYLEKGAIKVRDIASYTGFPEMMSGRLFMNQPSWKSAPEQTIPLAHLEPIRAESGPWSGNLGPGPAHTSQMTKELS